MIKMIRKFKLGQLYFNILYAFDTLTNAITLGDAREPVSSVLGKKELEGCKLCSLFCSFLSFIFNDNEHCIKSRSPIGYGTDDNWSPFPRFRRRFSNSLVIVLIVMFYFKNEIQQVIITIV